MARHRKVKRSRKVAPRKRRRVSRKAARTLCYNARAAVLSARSSKTRARAMKDYRKFYFKATGKKLGRLALAKKKASQLKGGFGSAARYMKMRELSELMPLPD